MSTDPHDQTDPWTRALRSAMGPARDLEPTDAEVRQALERADARRSRPQRPLVPRLAIAIVVAAVLASGVYAVPATRAAVGDLYGTLSEWISGDGGAAPGRAIPAGDQTPAWVTALDGEKRLIAGREGANLYVIRDGDELSVAIGSGAGITTTIGGWRERFARQKIVVLGLGDFPGSGQPAGGVPLDAHDRRALMGLTSKDVARIELRYTTGRPTIERGLDGGFVLLADARRKPSRIVAYDGGGRELARTDVGETELRVCRDPAGCPPGAWDPPGPSRR